MEVNRVKEIRKLRKLTQTELAKAVGVTQGSIQKLESGEITLDVKWMNNLSSALNVKPYELLPQEWQPSTALYNEEDLAFIIDLAEKYLEQANLTLSNKQKAKLYIILMEICQEQPANENFENKIKETIDIFSRVVTA